MALIKCKECNHDVSTTAAACPNCGAPDFIPDDVKMAMGKEQKQRQLIAVIKKIKQKKERIESTQHFYRVPQKKQKKKAGINRLGKCKDCGKEVSKSARKCPHCGGFTTSLGELQSCSFSCGCTLLILASFLIFLAILFYSC